MPNEISISISMHFAPIKIFEENCMKGTITDLVAWRKF
jgi:hypothetical protein